MIIRGDRDGFVGRKPEQARPRSRVVTEVQGVFGLLMGLALVGGLAYLYYSFMSGAF